MGSIQLIKGDITKLNFDAIVNAANPKLMKGEGVCGAIHRAAGHELQNECTELQECEVGNCKITKAYNLEQNNVYWVIHSVGPRWLGGSNDEDNLLLNTYENTLKITNEYREVYLKQCLNILEKYIGNLNESKRKSYKNHVKNNINEYVELHPIKTIAIPAISTGIYGFPLERATKIAVSTVINFLKKNSQIETVAFVCYDDKTYEVYRETLCSLT